MFIDWRIFYDAGAAVLAGLSPYSVAGYYNPMVVALLLAPTTLIPFDVWVWVMIGLSAVGIITVCRKRSHWVLLSFPFIYGMSWGSLDVFLFAPSVFFGGTGLALITLKPQLAIFIVPLKLAQWYRAGDWRNIRRFVLAAGYLWTLPVLLFPKWPQEWLQSMPKLSERSLGAASLAGLDFGAWWAVLLLACMLGVVVWLIAKRRAEFHLPMIFAPSLWASDYLTTMQSASWLTWLAGWVFALTGFSWMFALMPLVIETERKSRDR